MSTFRTLNVRPIEARDVEQLELFRKSYFDANIEIPHGYQAVGVETSVAEKEGKVIGSLTATGVVVFDDVHDETATGTDVFAAVLMMERALAYTALKNGLTTAYVAIPSHLEKYIEMVRKCGYDESLQGCTIMRRDLRTPVMPSLGDERDNTGTETVSE